MRSEKDTAGKPRYSLLSQKALLAIIKVREYGNLKYNGDTHATVSLEDWWNAAQRHMWAHQAGEILDPESGLPHLHHALTSLFLLAANEPESKSNESKV